jgi:diketogulonate reductase-like aldo/keto reductase
MNILTQTYTLSNGVTVPQVALGTWQSSVEDAEQATLWALQCGYRHIDTAAAYQNEEGVGRGLTKSGLPRSEIFVTTKIPAECKTAEEARTSIESSLRLLGTDFIDLMLIHWPKPWTLDPQASPGYFQENIAVWGVMQEYYKKGKLRSIGVSNFSVEDIENLSQNCEVAPMVNQIRFCPFSVPTELAAWCGSHGILVEAYSPIATGQLLQDGTLLEIAQKYGVSVAQLCIRFVLQKGALPLPQSVHKERIAENARLDFVIEEEDVRRMGG